MKKRLPTGLMIVAVFAIYFGVLGNDQASCVPGPKPGVTCASDNDCQANEFCDQQSGLCANFYDCTTDQDCAKVKAGCCPCSAGGDSTAINANYTTQWEGLLDCAPSTKCTMGYKCNSMALPQCANGRCVLNTLPDKKYCDSDDDCICGGIDTITNDCFVGNKLYYYAYVDSVKWCPDFCTGIDGGRVTRCIANKCQTVPQHFNQ